MTVALGKLEEVPAREIWPNEAADFTPWLAAEENIGRLAAAIGLELEVERTEAPLGPFFADILARDVGTNRYVVIENQLEKTNHDHLGKSITYAAAFDATTVVWVAPEFTDEHLAAIDWLNANSKEDREFFAVRVEAWRIDASAPAVRFVVLSRHSDLGERSISADDLTPAKLLQLEWWTQFRDAMLAAKVVNSARKPGPRYWYDVPLGRAGIHLSNTASTGENRISVRVYIQKQSNAEAAYAQLFAQREAIERELGFSVKWNANPDVAARIILVDREADLSKREDWAGHIEWMVEKTRRFRDVFGPRVGELVYG